MKITAFDIQRFGVWETLSIPNVSGGLNVVYGPNEAGKTTLLEFFRTMLYGFGDKRSRYVRPLSLEYGGGAVVLGETLEAADDAGRGGEMVVHGPTGVYHINRAYHAARAGYEETTEVTGRDGVLHGEHLLRILATGIDEATFNNIFAIGLDEIQRLATLGDSEAADILFRLSVGLDRVSLMEVLRDLRQMRHHLIDPLGKPGHIARLLKKRRELLQSGRAAEVALRDYAKLASERSELDRSIAVIETDLTQRQHEVALAETLLRVLPIYDRREALTQQVDGYGDVVEVSEATMKQLAALESVMLEKSRALDAAKSQREKTRQAWAALTLPKAMRRLAPRLEALLDEERRIIGLDEQMSVLRSEIAQLDRQLQEQDASREARRAIGERTVRTASTSPTSTTAAASAAAISPSPASGTSGDHKQLASRLRKSRVRYAKVKGVHAELEDRVRSLETRLTSELQHRAVEDIGEAMTLVGDEVTQLRRRQTVAQRLGEMAQYYREAAATNQHLLASQAVPLWMLGGLGLAVIVGITLVGLAMVGKIDIAFSILGGIAIIGGVATKIVLERSSATKLAQSQRQLRTLLGQMEQAKNEVAAIDQRYTTSGETVEARLARAEQELATLEGLLPVESKRRALLERLTQSRARLKKSKRLLATATERWNEWLKNAGLPIDWNAEQVSDLLNQHHITSELRRERDHRHDMLAQRLDEMRLITDRIDVAAVDLGFQIGNVGSGTSPLDTLNQFRERLAEYRSLLAQRKQLRRDTHLLERRRRKTLAELSTARRKLELLLFPFGVKTPAALRKCYDHYRALGELIARRDAVARELRAGLGDICREAEACDALAPDHRDEITPRLTLLRRAIETLSHQLHEQLQQRGRLDEQLTRLETDTSPMVRQREMAIIEERIRVAIHEWQRVSVAGLLLDEIRQTYERERQPQTLADTSVYLKRFTDNRYVRVWAPLGEETLYVDDADGQTWDVAWLSRGTREQLFISLRLALASSFARHGASLPIILDDVLVNCDTQRAEAAADVLLELAQSGQQVFLLTCHEHICRIFQQRQVSVLVLPTPRASNTRVQVLLPESLKN